MDFFRNIKFNYEVAPTAITWHDKDIKNTKQCALGGDTRKLHDVQKNFSFEVNFNYVKNFRLKNFLWLF